MPALKPTTTIEAVGKLKKSVAFDLFLQNIPLHENRKTV